MSCNLIFPSGPLPAPAQEIAARFCTENLSSPEYDKIKELEVFNAYDQLRIRRNVDDRDKGKANIPNCYEILNRSGHPIFKAVSTSSSEPSSSEPSTSKPFSLSLFDLRSGCEILKLVAKQGSDAVSVLARQKSGGYHGLGKILRARPGNRWRAPSYNIRGSSGKIIFKMEGGLCFFYKKASLNIVTGDRGANFGKVLKESEDADRRVNASRGYEEDDTVYRLRFPIDISMVSKALIVGSALVLDYDYFECGVKEQRSDFLLLSAGLAFVSVMVIMVIILISVSVTSKLTALSRSGNGTNSNELDRQFELLDDTSGKNTKSIVSNIK